VFICYQKSYQRKTLSNQRKIWFGFQKSVFLLFWTKNTFWKIMKNLEMSYYLLVISNLVFKLLIAIYILFWIFFFQFHLLEFNCYINFSPYFYNCYLFFPYYFLIKIFYLSNLIPILLIVTYFIWNNLWNVNYYYYYYYYYYYFFIFQFFLFLFLFLFLFILFEIIYEIIFFFNFILIQLFNL